MVFGVGLQVLTETAQALSPNRTNVLVVFLLSDSMEDATAGWRSGGPISLGPSVEGGYWLQQDQILVFFWSGGMEDICSGSLQIDATGKEQVSQKQYCLRKRRLLHPLPEHGRSITNRRDRKSGKKHIRGGLTNK